ncbi:hypothetical protein OC846_000799 [Tilletia horrida]|uniref:Uncharacterized protein n=1 Tax=Tilletia horrida TaxID=155126 RepID=A0AAN6H054_9BASI|nr:hypothetical protein OC846_000799 [Tilletia horrida]
MWTPAEDAKLRAMVHAAGDKVPRWSEIAKHLQGRNRKDVRKRWSYCLNPTLTKGAWSRQEDTLLRAAVQELGTDDWVHVASRVGSRTGDQCAKRWRDVLDPNIVHDRWTSTEDAKLIELTKKLGHNWSLIATHFPGRRGVQCRNRSHSLTKRLEAHGSLEAASTGHIQIRTGSSTHRRTANSTSRSPFQPYSSNLSGPNSSYQTVDTHLGLNNSATSLMMSSADSSQDNFGPMWLSFQGYDRASTTPIVPSVIHQNTTSATAYSDTSARHLVPLSPSQILHSPPMGTHPNVPDMFSMLHNNPNYGASTGSGSLMPPSSTAASRYYSDTRHSGIHQVPPEYTMSSASMSRTMQVSSMGQCLGPTTRDSPYYQPIIQRDNLPFARDATMLGSCSGPSPALYGHQSAYTCAFSGPGPNLSYLPASSPRQFNECSSAPPTSSFASVPSSLVDTKAALLPINFPSPGPNITSRCCSPTNSQGFIMPQPLPVEDWHCTIKCEPSETSLPSPPQHAEPHALIQANSPTASTGINPAMTLLNDILEEDTPTELRRDHGEYQGLKLTRADASHDKGNVWTETRLTLTLDEDIGHGPLSGLGGKVTLDVITLGILIEFNDAALTAFPSSRTRPQRSRSLYFSTAIPCAPPTSSNDATAALYLPFGFPIDIQTVAGDFIDRYDNTDVAVLSISRANAQTDIRNRIIHLTFHNVPLARSANAHAQFSDFLADTIAQQSITFNLHGTTTAGASTAAGFVTISDIPFDVSTLLLVLQNLKACPAIVSNLDVYHGYPSYLEVRLTASLYHPSILTIGTEDVQFNIVYKGQVIGQAQIAKLILVPVVNSVPIVCATTPREVLPPLLVRKCMRTASRTPPPSSRSRALGGISQLLLIETTHE